MLQCTKGWLLVRSLWMCYYQQPGGSGDWSRALTECSIRRGESAEGRKKDNLWFWKIVCSREMFGFS